MSNGNQDPPPWDQWRKTNHIGLGCWLTVLVGGGMLAFMVLYVWVAAEPL